MADDATAELLDLSRYEGHTPEPWAVGETRKNRGSIREWHETLIHVSSLSAQGRPDGNCLATVVLGGPGATSYRREDVEANARLIADAPALLVEVKRLTEERDALAEALREVLTSLAAFSLNVNLSASLNAAKDSGWVVLARAGRTPAEDRKEGGHGA